MYKTASIFWNKAIGYRGPSLSTFPSFEFLGVWVLFGASGCNGSPRWWFPAVTVCPAAGALQAASSSGSPRPLGWCWRCPGQSLQSSQPWWWCWGACYCFLGECQVTTGGCDPGALRFILAAPVSRGHRGHRSRSGRQRVGAVKMINFWRTTDHCGHHCL